MILYLILNPCTAESHVQKMLLKITTCMLTQCWIQLENSKPCDKLLSISELFVNYFFPLFNSSGGHFMQVYGNAIFCLKS